MDTQYSIPNMNVLFTCIGRRVSLLNSFRSAAKKLKISASFFGTDTTEFSSALQLCDHKFLVKPVSHPGYIKQLLDIVNANKVKLIVPTVDLDLKLLAENKHRFSALGCCVLVSDPDVVDICQDKRQTYKFMLTNGFDTPLTMSAKKAIARLKTQDARRKTALRWPLFLKPWDGYASRGNAVVKNMEELAVFAKRIPNCIAQEFVRGVEYTCDVYVDFNMAVRCVVPRRRIEVRTGEVSKGQTVKDAVIMNETARLVTKLGAGPGVITIQLFLTAEGRIKFIEINPRFGGGAPLSIKAGADFPKWLLQELAGRKPVIKFKGFQDGLTMLRYDSEVWMEK